MRLLSVLVIVLVMVLIDADLGLLVVCIWCRTSHLGLVLVCFKLELVCWHMGLGQVVQGTRLA